MPRAATSSSAPRILNLNAKNVEYHCSACFKTSKKRMSKCSRCQSAYYCSPECQSADWKDRHKKVCCAKDKAAVPKQKAVAMVTQEFKDRCARYLQAFHRTSATSDQKDKALSFITAAGVYFSDAARRMVVGTDADGHQTLSIEEEDEEIVYGLISAAFEMVGMTPPVRSRRAQ